MTTKNIVPRGDNQGSLGTPSKKWGTVTAQALAGDSLQVDNILINGNTISSTGGTDLLITPLGGQQLILDGTIIIDAGVVTGATSITSTAFIGALTGNASTATILATTRTIAGQNFNGSGNITIAAADLSNVTSAGSGAIITGAERTKLSNIETSADVTDKANVSAALASLTGADTLYVGDAGDDATIVIRGNLQVDGTTTTVDSTTVNLQNGFVFEGSSEDAHETTLTMVNPTGDNTINLPNQSGYIPVLAAASTTQISATPAELNLLDGATSAQTPVLATADRIIVNDNGSMKQVALSTLETFMESNLDTLGNITTGHITIPNGVMIKDGGGNNRIEFVSGGSMYLKDDAGNNVISIAANQNVTFSYDIYVNDWARVDALSVGPSTTDPGDNNCTVAGTISGSAATLMDLTLNQTAITATGTEINVLDGASTSNDTTGKAAILTTNGALNVASNLDVGGTIKAHQYLRFDQSGGAIRDNQDQSRISWAGNASSTVLHDASGNTEVTIGSSEVDFNGAIDVAGYIYAYQNIQFHNSSAYIRDNQGHTRIGWGSNTSSTILYDAAGNTEVTIGSSEVDFNGSIDVAGTIKAHDIIQFDGTGNNSIRDSDGHLRIAWSSPTASTILYNAGGVAEVTIGDTEVDFNGSIDVAGTINAASTLKFQTAAATIKDSGGSARIGWAGDTSNTVLYNHAGQAEVTIGDTEVDFNGNIKVSGGDIKGPTDADLEIRSDASVKIHLDDDADSTSNFTIYNGANSAIFSVDEANTVTTNLTASGGFSVGTGASGFAQMNVKQSTDASNGGIAVENSAAGRSLRLWADGNNRSRIDSGTDGSGDICINGGGSGKVAIGRTTTGYHGLEVYKNSSTVPANLTLHQDHTSGISQIHLRCDALDWYIRHTGTDDKLLFFVDTTDSGAGTSECVSFDKSGHVYIPAVTGTTSNSYMRINTTTGRVYYYSSQRDLKKNIKNLKKTTDGLSVINALRPVSFDFKSEPGIKSDGFIVEEVAEVKPNLVAYGNDHKYDANGEIVRDENGERVLKSENQVPISWHPDAIISHLVKAAQQQDETIKKLQERITSLESGS